MAKVTLKSVREQFKSVNNGSMFSIIKQVYAILDDRKEWAPELKKVLPANKKQALDEAQAIMTWGKVGEVRIIKRTNKRTNCITQTETKIKPSADMVLRYYVNKYNEAHK